MLSILIKFISLFRFLKCTIDINLSEFEYLADHLTEKECHALVAALHYHTFDMPKQLAAAERKLPDDSTCLDLLLHWNSAVNEGKGITHVEVCHQLNQINRTDLAEWLSKTVFHELSKNLDQVLTITEGEETTRTPVTVIEPDKIEIKDEAPWLAVDSVLSIFVVFSLIVLAGGLVIIIVIYCKRLIMKKKSYKKLPSGENNESSEYKSTDESDFATTSGSEEL